MNLLKKYDQNLWEKQTNDADNDANVKQVEVHNDKNMTKIMKKTRIQKNNGPRIRYERE